MIVELEIIIFVSNGICLNEKHFEDFVKSNIDMVKEIKFVRSMGTANQIKVVMDSKCNDCEQAIAEIERFFDNYSPEKCTEIGINHVSEFKGKRVKMDSMTVFEVTTKFECLSTRLY